MKTKKLFSFRKYFSLKPISLLPVLFTYSIVVNAQNPKIKCYFNHPVNTNVSSGTNAVFLSLTSADTIAAYIKRAKYTVDIAQYDYISSASSYVYKIAAAANFAYTTNGVIVRWIYDGSSPNSGLGQVNSGISRLASPTGSNYGIMHNKFIVIDANSSNPNDPILWTGSYDWSDSQNANDYNNMVIVQDKNVALAYYAQFNQMWGGTAATPNLANSKFGVYKAPSTQTSFTVNGTPIQVYFSPMDNTRNHLLNSVNSANSELFFGIYTFTDNTVATAISNKITGGVSGLGIMDQFSNTYSPYATLQPVMNNNLKVYSGGYIYHNKVLIVDALHPASDPQVFTGSYNWTSSASNNNDEGAIIIHDSIIANQYYQSLCKNFTDVGGAACPALSGIENFDYGQQFMAVYPNPFSDQITVRVKNGSEKLSVRISDQLGKTVLQKEVLFTDVMSFDLGGFNPGLYVVAVSSGNSTWFQKLIK